MSMKNYIESKLDEFTVNEYNPKVYLASCAKNNRQLAARLKTYRNRRENSWEDIKNTSDVIRSVERFEGTVRFVKENVSKWMIEDAFDMALTLDEALTGLRKMAMFCEKNLFHMKEMYFEATEETVNELFARLKRSTQEMLALNLKGMMQD